MDCKIAQVAASRFSTCERARTLLPSSSVTPAPGTRLAHRYLLGHALGHGGQAHVVQATDLRLHRPVAVKLFPLDSASPDQIRRYAQEARVLAGLSHPALVALLDVGSDVLEDGSSVAFLVMELVPGPTLRDVLRDGPLGPAVTADVGRQLALALAHAHGAGVLHRDVKPANVLVAEPRPGGATHGPELPVVLADFGIAVPSERSHSEDSAATAGYQSPEQALGRPLTAATDVYSLGLVLMECLTGERAYPGDPIASGLARLLRAPDVPTRFGRDWERLLRGMTELEPERRPPIAAVAAELRALRFAPAAG